MSIMNILKGISDLSKKFLENKREIDSELQKISDNIEKSIKTESSPPPKSASDSSAYPYQFPYKPTEQTMPSGAAYPSVQAYSKPVTPITSAISVAPTPPKPEQAVIIPAAPKEVNKVNEKIRREMAEKELDKYLMEDDAIKIGDMQSFFKDYDEDLPVYIEGENGPQIVDCVYVQNGALCIVAIDL